MPGRTVTVYPNELYHHGILGQKWGVRRFQNPDGTRTEAGKRRERNSSDGKKLNKETTKKVAVGIAGVSAAATLAVIIAKNPEKTKAAISAGANFIKEMGTATKNGVKEGIKSLPNTTREAAKDAISKSGRLITTGVVMLAGKELVDQIAGKVNAEKIYKANNNKKVDSFWKVYDDNFNNNKKKKKDDEDEDD